MKTIIFALFLLLSVPAFSQPEKDSLLAKDFNLVQEKLKLMHYLDKVTTEHLTMVNNEGFTNDDKTFPYYFSRQIVRNNPALSIDVKEYLTLDSKEYVPTDWKNFLSTVYAKNMQSLVELTAKYGYLSADRIKKYSGDDKIAGNVIFAVRSNKYDKQFKKMLKQEYKLGNISLKEYEQFKFFFQRKSSLTKSEINELENKTGNKVIFKDKP